MSGVDCDYMVAVTIIAQDNKEHTLPFYTRDRAQGEVLRDTLRGTGTLGLGQNQVLIRNVAVVKV
jgi:hypothetical protein